ncbi:Chitinase [Fusarium sp. LHS14.1]|nr:Chitinase [Fusarium sp. LHS14.1]
MAGFPRLSTRNGAFLLFFLLQFVFTLAQDEPQCSASKPCAKGCCSKWGFSVVTAKTDVCVKNCDQKAECDPGGFGREFVQIDKCPLNVCCYKSGFCGYTEEFCGQNKIDPPNCSSNSLQRVVGYYEGWSKNRICNKFMPEQIPLGVYTHLNYAFATIDPETFQVRMADGPDFKVLIAIGGWTFNDPGPTETTFSDIARSETNQKAFIKSLVSFLSTYNFDGIDLDWKYPKAKDRSGRDEDFETFPKFLANIKSTLKSTGRDELSITLPASYWYLQNFDLGKIEPHVDFFNIMSYDLHGTWDKGNEWVGPYLNAHTNLTEIKEAMNLLWRNNVSPDKVVLGTGFYGRAFMATSPDCLEPGCTYESGAPRQECSNEISVMMNSEIMDVISRTNASPKLDKEAAVKILTFDNNNWVAYDDEETLKMKADFAREQCLSGIMVWAVSHDVEDGRFSKAIGEAAGRKFTSIPIRGGMTMIEIDSSTSNQTETKHAQCKWTDCGQSCPANWIRVMRKDSGARKNEQMIDGSRCDSGVHELCCPPEGDLPTCGWYTHNNGKCDHTCPDGTFEIGSVNKYCSNSNYQSACCTNLDKVFLSSMGSGGAACSPRHLSIQDWEFEYQERKYCCKQEENHKWDDCQMYNNLGPGPSDDETFCRNGCPSDRVRVVLDPLPNRPDKKLACMRGAKAQCCIPKSSTFTKRESLEDVGLRDILDTFVESPFCYAAGVSIDTSAAGTAETGASKRSDVYHHQHQHGHTHHPHAKRTLQRRDAEYDSDTIKELVRVLLKSTATSNEKAIWDDTIGKKYPNLVWSKLAAYITKTKKISTWGVNQLSDLIVCNLSLWNGWVEDDKEEKCPCDTAYCCPGGGTECGSEDADDSLVSRRSFTPWEDFYLVEDDEADVSDLHERRVPGGRRVTTSHSQMGHG